jgi:hypothetical protein
VGTLNVSRLLCRLYSVELNFVYDMMIYKQLAKISVGFYDCLLVFNTVFTLFNLCPVDCIFFRKFKKVNCQLRIAGMVRRTKTDSGIREGITTKTSMAPGIITRIG